MAVGPADVAKVAVDELNIDEGDPKHHVHGKAALDEGDVAERDVAPGAVCGKIVNHRLGRYSQTPPALICEICGYISRHLPT